MLEIFKFDKKLYEKPVWFMSVKDIFAFQISLTWTGESDLVMCKSIFCVNIVVCGKLMLYSGVVSDWVFLIGNGCRGFNKGTMSFYSLLYKYGMRVVPTVGTDKWVFLVTHHENSMRWEELHCWEKPCPLGNIQSKRGRNDLQENKYVSHDTHSFYKSLLRAPKGIISAIWLSSYSLSSVPWPGLLFVTAHLSAWFPPFVCICRVHMSIQ